MQDTRQQILEILRRQGEVTVQELSQALDLTSVTVRHHLEILRSEGYITEPEVRRSNRPGRPRYVYRLTSTAADLFPNNYSGLASALLSALDSQMTQEEYEKFLQETAQCLAPELDEIPESPEARMDYAVDYLNRQGYVARWERDENGEFLLHVSSCPYHYVSQSHPQTCQIDRHLLQILVGGEITRTQGHAHEGTICSYEVRWDAG